jgi:hypothetical protein
MVKLTFRRRIPQSSGEPKGRALQGGLRGHAEAVFIAIVEVIRGKSFS